jgi:lysylphosphatidylglycerol synthetase-like protein (DUF2156 family)
MDLDRLYFWSSGDRAVLGFVLKGSQAVVIGGLIGPDAARETLLAEFMEHCRRHGWTAAFGLVPEHDLPLFDRYGFQSTIPSSICAPVHGRERPMNGCGDRAIIVSGTAWCAE